MFALRKRLVGDFSEYIRSFLRVRDDAVRAMLDEAVSRAIVAEEERNKGVTGKTAAEINSQSAEILKFIAEKL